MKSKECVERILNNYGTQMVKELNHPSELQKLAEENFKFRKENSKLKQRIVCIDNQLKNVNFLLNKTIIYIKALRELNKN